MYGEKLLFIDFLMQQIAKICLNGGVTTRNGCSFTKESIVWI